jgi:glycosyltransferase involved in cell wall biosynthesis
MKVLMFGWEFPPFNTGGLGTHCYHLTKALSRRGNRVTFVMPKMGKGIRHDFLKIVEAEDARLIEIGSSLCPYIPSYEIAFSPGEGKGGGNLYGKDLFARVESYTRLALKAVKNEDCDVIHSHDWMTFRAGILAKKEKGKPLVVTVHSTEYDRNPLTPNPWIMHIEWEGMYEANKIITVSNYMKARIMEKYGVPEWKINVIYNAVETSEFSGERTTFGTGEKIVLFLGRLAMQKGPDHFLRAAKKVLEKEKNVRFLIVGTGHMLPQLIDETIELGIADKVTFTGYQDSILECYKMADLYVMPSISEPFGITALEAMASGVPVIVSKQSGVSEVLKHAMKVDFWDINSMADKMLGVLRYAPIRGEMVRNGSREVDRVTWAGIAEKTERLYLSLGGG